MHPRHTFIDLTTEEPEPAEEQAGEAIWAIDLTEATEGDEPECASWDPYTAYKNGDFDTLEDTIPATPQEIDSFRSSGGVKKKVVVKASEIVM